MKYWHSKSAEMIETASGQFLVMQVEGRSKQFTVAPWAAYVTAVVRGMLFDSLSENALYCDTDSIFLPKRARFKGTISNDLGGWKLEQKRVIKINTLKDYDYIDFSPQTPDKILPGRKLLVSYGRKLKGVKKNSIQVSDFEFQYLRMIRTRECFRRIDGLPAGTFINQRKKISGNYSKREVLKFGKTRALKF
jgi:hypothetical protein